MDEGGVADGGGNEGGTFTVGVITEWSDGEGEARRREAEEAVEMVGGAGVGVVGTKPERREKTTERNPC